MLLAKGLCFEILTVWCMTELIIQPEHCSRDFYVFDTIVL